MKGSRRILVIVLVVVGVLFLSIQFVPVDRSNPASQTQVPASAEVRSVLKRACYDCHSNETVWPWYSYIAPVSWLVARDVAEGREELNFSTWNLYSAEEQSEAITEAWEKVQEGEMPPWFYLPLHPSAKLSPSDRAVLQTWAGGVSGTESGTNTGTGAEAGAGTGSGAAPGVTGSGTDKAWESTTNGDVDNDGDDD